jgi:hypothetical protein
VGQRSGRHGHLTWSGTYDKEAHQADEEHGIEDMRLYGLEAVVDDAGDEAHRAVLREYLRGHRGGRAPAWYLSGPPVYWQGGT